VPYWLRLNGSYSVPIGWGATASLAARYQFVDPDQFTLSPLVVEGDRYGADVTLSAPLGQAVSASVTAGVSNESYEVSLGSLVQDDSPEARIMLRLFVRPDDKTRISASYDSLNNASYVSGHRSAGGSLDRWEGDVNVQHEGDEQKAMANGSLAYTGNRGEVRLAHTGNFDEVDWQQASPLPQEQRTSLRVGTGLAFAGSHFAVGQPVRGGAFAIVHPHESLAGNEVTVGATGEARARANGLGPALVTDIPAYSRSTIPVDVADLPVGYSLGAGAFDVVAPYRGGYALEVGTASSVSAYGTLLLADFSPCALVTGIAHPIDNPLQQVAVFTNKAGRFGAEGLAPGKWIIEMATDGGPTRYEIEVPQGTDGLFQAGLLMPAGAE
jgi:outer membrane usher protein